MNMPFAISLTDLVADAIFPTFRLAKEGEDFILSNGGITPYRFDVSHDDLEQGGDVDDVIRLIFLDDILVRSIEHQFRFGSIVGIPTGGEGYARTLAHRCFGQFRVDCVDIPIHNRADSLDAYFGVGPGCPTHSTLIIDDVATTGDSIVKTSITLKRRGLTIVGAAVILYREGGAAERLAQEKIPLLYLITARQAIERYRDTNRISWNDFSRCIDHP